MKNSTVIPINEFRGGAKMIARLSARVIGLGGRQYDELDNALYWRVMNMLPNVNTRL